MNLDKFTGPGSTPVRRRFWDSVAEVVTSSQKLAGHHINVGEFEGQGTIINTSQRREVGCVCPDSITSMAFSGISIFGDCVDCEETAGTIQWSDLNVNETATVFTTQGLSCDPPASSCAWRVDGDPRPKVQYLIDCTGDEVSENLFVAIALINCTWFVFATSFVCGITDPSNRGSVVFYGEAASLSSPIANTITFTPTVTIDSPLMAHLFGDCTGAQTFRGIGSGGTVTVITA